ncbi:MAG: DUF1428 domain-containing protein [Flavobacteriales bacterium]|nr:DUF1428 domain-containing protein [Flavobacteriales bacterium]
MSTSAPPYLDCFIFPILRIHLDKYRNVAEQVAAVWKEYGALSYQEYLGDELHLEGTRSYVEAVELKTDEVVVVGWVVFPSKGVREEANKRVPEDPRMARIVGPLVDPERMIFDASRMIYGGFTPLVQR